MTLQQLASQVKPAPETSKSKIAAMSYPVIRVLLIDKDEDHFVLVEDLLAESETHRFIVDWVASYTEARVAIANDQYDAYVLDYQLGGHTGLELLQEYATQVAAKPFIMMTGYEDLETESNALTAGAIDYLSKDALSARLLAKSIRYAITIKQTQVLLQEKIEELRMTQARIIQTEKLSALGTMVAGIAHELNNPLMGLLNYVEYAQRRVDDTKIETTLGKAVRELRRIQRIVNNMLTFARPSEKSVGQADISEAINRAMELMATDLRHQDIRIDIDLPPALPPVRANLSGLQQVFLNLLANARDALATSEEKIVTISACHQEPHVYVKVRDSGIGIPATIQARIFDPFFTTKPPGKGTGLGLSVSRNILLSFGAQLTCDNQNGLGTTFVLTLKTDEIPQPQRKTTKGNKAWPH